MAERVTDLLTGYTFDSFDPTPAAEEETGAHEHSEHADADHVHDDITSFDVTSGTAQALSVGDLNANEVVSLYGTFNTKLEASELDATTVNADHMQSNMVHTVTSDAHTAKIGHNLYYRDQIYEISDKFHKVGNAATAEDEVDTDNPTLVVRDRATGCRVSNLVVRADSSSEYTGAFPGLFFDRGTCSTKLSLVDDGQVEFVKVDQQGNAVSGENARFGYLNQDNLGVDVAGDSKIAMIRGGLVQVQAGTGENDNTVTSCFAVTTNDGHLTEQMIIDSRGTQHFYRSNTASDVPLITMRQPDGTLLWLLNAQGEREFVTHSSDDPTHANAGSAPAQSVDSVAVGDNSLYIGSAKLSYDRSSNALTFKRLKNTSLPKFFTDLGHDNTTLPSGYDLSQMSVQRYLALARNLQGDDTLHLKDVFPVANENNDWQDAGNLLTGTVPTSVTHLTDVSSAGSGAIITSNERIAIGNIPTSVTHLSDVTSAGSGVIISTSERTAIGTLQSDVSTLQTDVTALQNSGGGGGGNQTDLTVENASGSASITISSDTDTANAKSVLTFISDSNNNNQDRTWTFHTDPANSDGMILKCETAVHGVKECMRFAPGGMVSFPGGLSPQTNLNIAGFTVRSSAWFRSTLRTSGDILLDSNCTIRRATTGGEDLLAGGGSSATTRFDVVENGNVSGDIQLSATDTNVLWMKQRGTLGHGGLGCYKLPPTADISDGHTIQFHGFSKSWTSSSEMMAGGSIILKTNTGQTFGDPNRYLYWDTDISGTTVALTISHLYRRTIWAIWDETDDQWWVKGSDSIDRINYTKHFDSTSTDHDAEGKAFQLPQGFKFYYVSFGQGLAGVSGTDHDCYFKPPGNAPVGTRIEVAFLFPNTNPKLYWVDQSNQDSTQNGSIVSSPFYFTQTAMRRRHLMIKVSATRWAQLRNN